MKIISPDSMLKSSRILMIRISIWKLHGEDLLKIWHSIDTVVPNKYQKSEEKRYLLLIFQHDNILFLSFFRYTIFTNSTIDSFFKQNAVKQTENSFSFQSNFFTDKTNWYIMIFNLTLAIKAIRVAS